MNIENAQNNAPASGDELMQNDNQVLDGNTGQMESGGNPENSKATRKEYDGSKHPMLALSMIKTSAAMKNAIVRIDKRRTWIAKRIPTLQGLFNSNDPMKKKDAFDEAKSIKQSLSKLDLAEKQLKEELPTIQKNELENLSRLEFPEFDI
jgi:hypothetical protein